MATKIRPIVFKINEPEGFVMNASNATISQASGSSVIYVSWHSPSYPDNGYDGDGKQCVIVNNNESGIESGKPTGGMMYGNSVSSGGPWASSGIDLDVGTRTVTLIANPAPTFGAYFVVPFNGNEEQVAAYLTKLTITILNP